MIVTLCVGPGFAKLSRQQRKTLLVLRGIVIALALLALLRPGIVSKISQQQTAVLAVLLDFSRSMRLPHLSTGPSRWDSMRNMIDANQALFDEIARQNIEVRFYGFGSSLMPLNESAEVIDWPQNATAAETDLGSSIYSIIDSVRDQRLIGIVVASDGVQNAPDPEIELSQAAKFMSDSQTPLFAVPFGQPAENEQFADIALSNMADQYTVWVKNDLVVNATVEARGFANREIPIQLIVIDEKGNQKLVDTIRQKITKQSQTQTVELKYTPSEAGQFRLLVRAQPQEAEVSPRNNELPAFLTVNEGGLRVLYLYGSLNWEQAYLKRSLGAYQDIQLDMYYVDARSLASTGRPLNLQHLFGDPQYDVFILHDVDARAIFQPDFQEENLNLLADAVVNQGKGFLMIGGFHSFGAGLFHSTPLKDVLPIEMEFWERQDFEPAKISKDLHINRPLSLRVATRHFITRLGGPDENAAIWQQLPPLGGANNFVNVKDTAGILLESTDGDPILVATQVGGRVLAFAGDQTYKWWTHGFKNHHKQFWRQVILWLAFKDASEDEDISIDLPQRRYQPNSQVKFTVNARTQTQNEIRDIQLSGKLITPDGSESAISISPGQNPSQIDRALINEPGIYAIEVEGRRGNDLIATAKREFAVFDNDKEQATPGADPDQLNRLVERTTQWGGKMVEPPEFDDLLREFAEYSPKMKIDVPLKWQLGDTPYDALTYVLVFVGLITTEWYLRKKWGMV